ncbi:MAG: hypothetical protein WDN44_07505 [Sphingomonas sp.]
MRCSRARIREPTLVAWNRLEGRPRQTDFSQALKAEVRDPLWLLTRQWQMGEFDGEDAASPVGAKLAWASDPLATVIGPDGASEPYDASLPLEAVIEARPVPLERAGRPHDLELRLALGRRWERLLDAGGLGAHRAAFAAAYPFIAPDPAAPADAAVTAAAPSWQTAAAIADRAIDGGALFLHLADPANRASDGLGLADPARTDIDTLGQRFVAWARSRQLADATLGTWLPQHLEYSAALACPEGPARGRIAASEYRGGRLDWFHWDAVAAPATDAPGAPQALAAKSFLPTTATFDGMPNTRYWAFEEGATNFGEIKPDTTGHRQAAARRVRARLRQRLVPAAAHAAGGDAHAHPWAGGHQLLRRTDLDRARGRSRGPDAELADVPADRQGRGRSAAVPRADRRRGARRADRRGRRSGARRGRQHGVGHRADRADARGHIAARARGGDRAPRRAPGGGAHGAARARARECGDGRVSVDDHGSRELDPIHPRPCPGQQPRGAASARGDAAAA